MSNCPATHWTGMCQRPEGHRGRHRGRAGAAETTWGETVPLSLDDVVRRATQHGGDALTAIVDLMLGLAETVDDMLGPQPQPEHQPQPQPDPDSTVIRATGQKTVHANWDRPKETP